MSVTRKKIVNDTPSTYTKSEVDALIAGRMSFPDIFNEIILKCGKNIRFSQPFTSHTLPDTHGTIAWGGGCSSSDANWYYYKLNNSSICQVKVATESVNYCTGSSTTNGTCRRININVNCLVRFDDGDFHLYIKRGSYARQFIGGRSDDLSAQYIYAKSGDIIYVRNDAYYLSVIPM